MNPVVRHTLPGKVLTPTGGFLSGYSHSLNPYTGCAFACAYCYVRRMPVGLFRKEPWGTWVDVKDNAAERLRKELAAAKRKGPVTIFMSSSTDPYQPAEYRERLTRSLLEVMADDPPHFLFVQTRSPLVTRDIDLFQRLAGRIRISVTVETDLESVRRAFSPAAPPIPARLRALRELGAAGLPVQAAVAPLLPHSPSFAKRLAETVTRVCVDDFFTGDGSGGRRTEALHIRDIYERLGCEQQYARETAPAFIQELHRVLPDNAVLISQQGFAPG